MMFLNQNTACISTLRLMVRNSDRTSSVFEEFYVAQGLTFDLVIYAITDRWQS